MPVAVPYIDPNVEHVGVSKLRSLNAATLRKSSKALVIQDNSEPLAVLLTYGQFLEMQKQLQSIAATIEVLTDEDERAALVAGVKSIEAGKVRSLASIRADLKKGK